MYTNNFTCLLEAIHYQ